MMKMFLMMSSSGGKLFSPAEAFTPGKIRAINS